MTKIQSIYAFVTMVVGIAVASFFVFKWTNTRETTDVKIIQWMEKQDSLHIETEQFHEVVLGGIEVNRSLIDSALVITKQNQQAIYANRRVIVKQIQEDTSLSGGDVFEMLQPLMEGVEDLKKNNSTIVFVE